MEKKNHHSTMIKFFHSLLGVIGVVLLLFSTCSAFCTEVTHATRNTLTARIRHHHHHHGLPPSLLHLAPQQLGEFESLSPSVSTEDKEQRKVALLNFLNDDDDDEENIESIPFQSAWDMQKGILAAHVERLASSEDDESLSSSEMRSQFLSGISEITSKESSSSSSSQTPSGKDTVIFLQHQPVYTLGTGSDEKFIIPSDSNDNTNAATAAVPVVRMDRGGEVTYHGPGQLTVYPIFDLRGYKQDIHWYIRALEEAVIRALSHYGLPAERQDGITGVWVENRKVAAVGIKCRKWITMHGLAVNVEEQSLLNFNGIVPCGLENRQVGCINQFLSDDITLSEFSETLQRALEEVFQIDLVQQPQSVSSAYYRLLEED